MVTHRRQASHDEVIDIFKMLERMVTVKDGIAVYMEGYNDEAVANSLQVSVSSVASVRAKRFGPLSKPGAPISQLFARMTVLEKAVAALQAKVDQLMAADRAKAAPMVTLPSKGPFEKEIDRMMARKP
jgi:uncharacterized protein YceH (UPF0502 family)